MAVGSGACFVCNQRVSAQFPVSPWPVKRAVIPFPGHKGDLEMFMKVKQEKLQKKEI